MVGDVVVTGGASGLGRIVAHRLLERGRPVIVVDRDPEAVDDAARDFGSEHGTPVPVVVADLSDLAAVRGCADELSARFTVAALVNNAGGWLPGDQYPDADARTWLSGVTLNLLAPMLLTQLLWPSLAAAAGAVVNIGSSGGLGDSAYGSPEYGAAKAGLHRFTVSLASRRDVRVMGVVPGWIGLPRARAQWESLAADERRRVGPLIPPRRIADAVVSLIDDGRAGELIEILGRPGTG